MKLSLVACGVAAALLTVSPNDLRADPPDISGIGTREPTFLAAAGTTGFTTTFLFGRAGNDNTLLYRVGSEGMWARIFFVDGIAPAATIAPPAGTVQAITFDAPLASNSQVFFALCQGNIPSGNLSQCTGQGPFLTGVGATNVISLSAAGWNSARGTVGVDAVLGETVFGFEDVRLDISDEDFNDLVFSTSLQAVSTVPEPASVALMLAGLAGLTGMLVRRRNHSA